MTITTTKDASVSIRKLIDARAQAAGGSETFYTSPLYGQRYVYTTGVQHHCEVAQSYWLLDLILSNAKYTLSREQREYSVIELVVPHHESIANSASKPCKYRSTTDDKGRWRLEGVIMNEQSCDGIPYSPERMPEAIVTFHDTYCRDEPPSGSLQANQVVPYTDHPPGRWKFILKSGAVPMKGATDFGDDWPNMALGWTLMLPNED